MADKPKELSRENLKRVYEMLGLQWTDPSPIDEEKIQRLARDCYTKALRDAFAPMIISCAKELLSIHDSKGFSKKRQDAAFQRLREMFKKRDDAVVTIHARVDANVMAWFANGTLANRLTNVLKVPLQLFQDTPDDDLSLDLFIRDLIETAETKAKGKGGNTPKWDKLYEVYLRMKKENSNVSHVAVVNEYDRRYGNRAGYSLATVRKLTDAIYDREKRR